MPKFVQSNITGYLMSKHSLHPLTEKINKKQKAIAKQSRSIALRWLAQTFPHAFDDTVSIHPLKLGIMHDILAHEETKKAIGISKTKLREAVILFTRRIDYLTCLKAREMRIDLNGNPTVLVSEEEAEQAAAKIKKQIEKSAKLARLNSTSLETTTVKSTSKSTTAQFTLEPIPYPNDTNNDPRYAMVQPATKTTPVIVKHKATKTYDPDAVARLKEKLGLNRSLASESTH